MSWDCLLLWSCKDCLGLCPLDTLPRLAALLCLAAPGFNPLPPFFHLLPPDALFQSSLRRIYSSSSPLELQDESQELKTLTGGFYSEVGFFVQDYSNTGLMHEDEVHLDLSSVGGWKNIPVTQKPEM